jgi:hypothetical protein
MRDPAGVPVSKFPTAGPEANHTVQVSFLMI